MIIIYKESKDGKIEFTKEELENLLEQARKEGYDTGYSKGYGDGYIAGKGYLNITTPTSPITPSPWWTSPTITGTGGDIPLNNKIEG